MCAKHMQKVLAWKLQVVSGPSILSSGKYMSPYKYKELISAAVAGKDSSRDDFVGAELRWALSLCGLYYVC